MLRERPSKTVLIPVCGSVTITPVQPLVDHPLFQRLRWRAALGAAQITYPGATHTRFEHSLGVYQRTCQRLRRLLEWGQISDQEACDVRVFALLHDIGHGPGSHMTDSLVREDHDRRAVELLREMGTEIAACGADLEKIIRMVLRKNPLHSLVMNTPLGTDKIDYLGRDAYHSGLGGMQSEDVYLDNAYWLDGKLVADAKIYEQVCLLVQFYRTMYSRLYFRPAVILSERYIQRMVSILLGHTGEEPEFNEAALVAMTDMQLGNRLECSGNPMVREEYSRYMCRAQPMPALLLQPAPFYLHNWAGGHSISYQEVSESVLASSRLRRPEDLYSLEREIEKVVSLPPHSVLAVPPVPARRFAPQNVLFATSNGITSIQDMSPDMWEAQSVEAHRYAGMYVGTYKEQCPILADPAVAAQVAQCVAAYAG